MEKMIITYLLIGAIVAVITAIGQDMIARRSEVKSDPDGTSVIPAYLIIALVWPISVAITLYSFVTLLFADHPR